MSSVDVCLCFASAILGRELRYFIVSDRTGLRLCAPSQLLIYLMSLLSYRKYARVYLFL